MFLFTIKKFPLCRGVDFPRPPWFSVHHIVKYSFSHDLLLDLFGFYFIISIL